MNKIYFLSLLLALPVWSQTKIPTPCLEEKIPLLNEFVPTNFDEGRGTVGKDQVEPVKNKILSFISTHPQMIVTDIVVVADSSKAPFYTTVAGKKVLDPKSDEKNLSLAIERAQFASQILNEIKNSKSELGKVNFESKAELAGPDFFSTDLNTRFVTPMTPHYKDQIQNLFDSNQEVYEKQALKKSAADLLDEKIFVNLYQAKFKPFQGFRISITGYDKAHMKCKDEAAPGSTDKVRAVKQ